MLLILVIAYLFPIILYAKLPYCGIDKLPKNFKFDKLISLELKVFPWLGTLYYPIGDQKRLSTSVVLVTKQMVIASALELSQMPKKDFRVLAKVVLGQNCSMPGIPIREYIYHPEFKNSTMASLALIQLDLDHVKQDLMPICPPPKFLAHPTFYATRVYSGTDCYNPLVNIYKMEYVSLEDCHAFYRKTGLEMAVLWPKNAACGKALFGGDCLWMEGTALSIKQFGRWRMMGLGLYGPGCEAPSKFIDYLMYRNWVEHKVKSPGRTTLTRIANNHIILRRALSHVQRFGPCDEEESKYEIYSEKTTIDQDVEKTGKATYNLTLLDTVEYACVVLRCYHYKNTTTPRIKLRRWCASASRFCYDHHHIEIKFQVIINFEGPTTYEVAAYGRQIKTMDPMKAMKYVNQNAEHPKMPKYNEFYDMFQLDKTSYKWVKGWQGGSYKGFKIRRYEVYEHCVSNATMFFDKRFCGQYEFTVEPKRWFKLKPRYAPHRISFNDHFVWRYLSQRKKLQYPLDGYEVVINPDEQDINNELVEKNSVAHGVRLNNRLVHLYTPSNYNYNLYGHTFKYPANIKPPNPFNP